MVYEFDFNPILLSVLRGMSLGNPTLFGILCTVILYTYFSVVLLPWLGCLPCLPAIPAVLLAAIVGWREIIIKGLDSDSSAKRRANPQR